MKTDILGINFDVIDLDECTKKLIDAIDNDKKIFVVTPNPEIVMLAQNDNEFKNVLDSADIVIPDGIGIVLASKLNKIKIKKRVAGYDLVQKFFSMSKNYKIYFLGSTSEIIQLAQQNMSKKFPNINIVGVHNGFFDDDTEIIEQINSLKPDVLLVGMGAPKQEKWIFKYKDQINAKIFIGVGGSFDVMSGKIKRAPVIFQKLGLEWFHRLIKQPKRFFRMLALPKFLFAVLLKKIS